MKNFEPEKNNDFRYKKRGESAIKLVVRIEMVALLNRANKFNRE